MPYTAKQRALFNARAKSDPKFKALAEEANSMAAKKQPMGTKKSRTGGAMMPKKGMVKKASVSPKAPKSAGGMGTGGGVSRSGGGY